jgi:hypothetical protein
VNNARTRDSQDGGTIPAVFLTIVYGGISLLIFIMDETSGYVDTLSGKIYFAGAMRARECSSPCRSGL